MLTVSTRNAQLDILNSASFVSLHYDYSEVGANELAGGSYARQPVTWLASSSAVKSIATQLVFNVPAGGIVAWFGLWTAITGGTFVGMTPNCGATADLPSVFISGYSGSTTLLSTGNSLLINDTVTFLSDGTQDLPTGLTVGAVYYVVSSTQDTFEISPIRGGIPATVAVGTGLWQRCAPELFDTSGTFGISALNVYLQ